MGGQTAEQVDAGDIVHIVDDDAMVRRSLAMLLRMHGLRVREFASGPAVLAALPLSAGCMVIDLRMPGMDGVSLLVELRRRGCAHPAVIVSGHADVRVAVTAMKAGAVDVIEKPYSQAVILMAIRAALRADPAGTAPRDSDPVATERLRRLTPREQDVLRGMVAGLPNKAIGQQLGISPRTVEIHRAHVMEKLECRSLADALRLAMLAGLGEVREPFRL